MLTVHGRRHTYCDGISRRDFLRAGVLGLGGLTFPDLLRLRAQAGQSQTSHKSAIMIFLSGGPSHIDSWDMKPDAPVEIRGEFKPIHTSVPGMDWCEHMPLLAQMADKIALLRGVHTVGNHTGNEFFSGFAWEQGKPNSLTNQKRPAVGSVVSRVQGSRNGMPSYVSLHDNATWEHPYYLGAAHRPFRTVQREKSNQGLANLALPPGIGLQQVHDRKALLGTFDGLRRDLDAGNAFEAADAATAQALEIMTSGKVRDAFDLNREPAALKARYGTKEAAFNFIPGLEFLLARRLVEAGVPVVSLAIHGWDTHEKNFEVLRKQLPIVDQAFSALLMDLETRGMLQDVVLIMGGEMGRSPKIDKNRAGGRDHWPETGVTLMAGGGLKTGQVVGSSDSKGAQPKSRHITPQMMISTVYQAMGIDASTTFPDATGRPMYLLDEREPIKELLQGVFEGKPFFRGERRGVSPPWVPTAG